MNQGVHKIGPTGHGYLVNLQRKIGYKCRLLVLREQTNQNLWKICVCAKYRICEITHTPLASRDHSGASDVTDSDKERSIRRRSEGFAKYTSGAFVQK
jgi:hypothetical protein